MSDLTTTTKLTVKPWLAKREGLVSRELVGEITARSAKAVRFVGTVVLRESDHCLRCGRDIENPVSRLAGYGPWCSDELGIPRNFTEAQLAEVREAVKVRVRIDQWFPLSAVTVTEGALPEAAPEDDGAAVTVVGGKLRAVTPFRAKDLVKSVRGGRWNPQAKAWEWAPSPVTAAELVGKLRTAKHVGAVTTDAAVEALVAQADEGAAAATHKVVDEADVPGIDLDPLGQPDWWIHQRRAFHFARGQQAAGLFIGMGGGKSRVAVDLVRDAGDQRVLILCPKNVVGVWPKQFRLYAGEEHAVLALRKGSVAKRAEQLVAALRTPGPLVVVLNYESAWRAPMAELLLGTEWDRVILDESHRIKAPGGKASRFCERLGRVAKRRLCLTGTPMPHSPLDVYGQYRFLDPGVFGRSFVKFRSRYAVMGGYGGYEVLGYQRQDELSERAYSCAYRIADEELDAILGLEAPTHDTIQCELSPKARRTYNALWNDLVAKVGAGEVSADNALVRLLRLQQVTSGHLPVDVEHDDEVERVIEEVDTAKRDALADLIEDLPEHEPVVVFCRFTHDLDNVRKVAEAAGRTYGELSARRRDALTEDSTLAEGVDVAGVQMQAGGVGVDFSRSHYCVFYSVGFSLGDYDQALKRTHRPGQTHRVSYYHVTATDTVDEQVYAALRERKDVVDYVLGLAR